MFNTLLLLPLLGAASVVNASVHAHRKNHSVDVIPSAIANATSEAQFVYTGTGLDGPKVHPINGTVFDWWYFHAYSTDPSDLSHVAVFFYSTSPGAYQVLTNKTSALDLGLFGSFKNGTPFWLDAYPGQATVTTVGDFTSGVWGDYGSWTSSKDGRSWNVEWNIPEQNFSGSVKLKAIAPPALPCSGLERGKTYDLTKDFGIAYTVPDADSTVEVVLGNDGLNFNGYGYHDRSWGLRPFTDIIGSWYWGTGRLGPYSFVFYDVLDVHGYEHFSAYMSKNGKIVSSSCSPGSVLARPWGGDDVYPPNVNQTGQPLGLTINFLVDGMPFYINATSRGITNVNYAYTRWLDNITGDFRGTTYTGQALIEVVKV